MTAERARRRTGISQTRHRHIKPTSFPGEWRWIRFGGSPRCLPRHHNHQHWQRRQQIVNHQKNVLAVPTSVCFQTLDRKSITFPTYPYVFDVLLFLVAKRLTTRV
ncbi:hypothetical protein P167DRAFT_176300 [Morchella conica CCBAS932]|uniref:Uncharacterized protein n=1 Tax=Morchella conica CCBAS932 TaxID=1392247 RepID=A0A3N4L282_9PEZI|nr:hypothetical protein P167DRAFT_176300 [Morchella conica CCBAS932]